MKKIISSARRSLANGFRADEYQIFFPIGMGKIYPDTHYVTAHGSPDLDTTVASFWGWVDAFAARVAEGLHIWNVPGGPPLSQIEIGLLFHQIFGEKSLIIWSKHRTTLITFWHRIDDPKGGDSQTDP